MNQNNVAVKRPKLDASNFKASEESSITRVAIIGTAGRYHDFSKLNLDIYNRMYDICLHIITSVLHLALNEIALVSGGSAWSDHLAVRLYLEHVVAEDISPNLTLYLPCDFHFDGKDTKAVDTGQNDWRINPGRTLNKLHKDFSRVIERNSLLDIHSAKLLGADIDCSKKGFHARNTMVAKCEYMIAFTFGDSVFMPCDGGTKDTWCKSTGTKIHVPINLIAALAKDEPITNVTSKLKIQYPQSLDDESNSSHLKSDFFHKTSSQRSSNGNISNTGKKEQSC